MGSTDLAALERRARLRYEWTRLSRSVVGFAPALGLIGGVALLGRRPSSALLFGGLLFVGGVLILWRGTTARRAVLPGVLAGLIPLALALAANRGHGCHGDHCTSLCLPACTVGGVLAGLLVSTALVRRGLGWPAWAAASALSVLTGAMGCACVGSSGVLGLALGFGLGVAPQALRRTLARA